MAYETEPSTESDLPKEVKDFYQEREGAESENREAFLDDLKFVYEPGAQWSTDARNRRQGRICYTYNRVAGAVNQLIGDQRMTQPSGKVRATNKQSAAPVAEMIGGLIREIEESSGATDIYAEQFKYAVAGAWGAWRIVPEYAEGDTFDQVLRVKRIPNPLTVYFDEQADPFGRGAMKCVVAEKISKDTYESLYGDQAYTSLSVSHDSQGWCDENEVRIAEYYKMDCRDVEIAQLSNGQVQPVEGLEAEFDKMRANGLTPPEIVRKRIRKEWFCTWSKVDGTNVLEGPIEYRYKFIPVIRVPGRHINIEGEQLFQSLIRHGKDAQRTYNYDRSSMVETVALTPRAPYLVTSKMIQGYEPQWQRANVSNASYLEYNIDEDAPNNGMPYRQAGVEVPSAFIALAAHDAEDIKQTTGYSNPAIEQQTRAGDAESGRALRTRMAAGDSGSYEFLDNFAKAVKYSWSVMIDMIPVHYDTERVVRILGVDGAESFEKITPEMFKDARFDVTVTLGPAYATARMEALDTLLEATDRMPIIGEVAPDIIVKNLDVRGADEIERRIRHRLISSGQIQPNEEEKAAGIQPPPPDPAQKALEEQLNSQTQKNKADAAKTTVETAVRMAEADAAPRKEQLELAQMVQEIAMMRAEIMKIQKEIITPDRGTQ